MRSPTSATTCGNASIVARPDSVDRPPQFDSGMPPRSYATAPAVVGAPWGMTVVAGGVALGLLVALAATRAMSSLLFGVGAADVSTFAAVAALMTVVAFAACALPAHRAVGVQPASVLRDE
jgi:hypothetical protein